MCKCTHSSSLLENIFAHMVACRDGPRWGPGPKKRILVSKFSPKIIIRRLGPPFLFSPSPPPKILNHPTKSASPEPI